MFCAGVEDRPFDTIEIEPSTKLELALDQKQSGGIFLREQIRTESAPSALSSIVTRLLTRR